MTSRTVGFRPAKGMGPASDFELLFVVTYAEMINENARWSEATHDVQTLLGRIAFVDRPAWKGGRPTLKTVCSVYAAPLRDQGCKPTPYDRTLLHETLKHLRAKYPEFLPPAERRAPTHIKHVREV